MVSSKNERRFIIKMQVLKDDVKSKIHNAGVENFMAYGYEKASMRQIAKDAGISVGNLYRYYPNKEAMFDSIVEPALAVMKQKHTPEHMTGFLESNLLLDDEVIEKVVEARLLYRKEMTILLLKSRGSKYDNILETIQSQIESNVQSFLDTQFTEENKIIEGDLYAKLTASSIVHSVCSILESSDSDFVFLKNIMQFLELNVKSVMKTLLDMRDEKVNFRRINYEEIYSHYCHCRDCGDSHHSKGDQ